MNPSVDDRIASIVRALTDIVLPALPHEAGLAQEQTQLAIGHLQILRAQLDAGPGFEAEELTDARSLAEALLVDGAGGTATSAALAVVRAALQKAVGGENVRQTRVRINGAVDDLIRKTAVDGSGAYRATAAKSLVRLQGERALKDRKWFSLMGFDSDIMKTG